MNGVDLGTIVLIAGAAIGVIGIGLALVTPQGREAVAKLGLRVADALVSVLERMLSRQQQQQRALDTASRGARRLDKLGWPPGK